MALGVIRNERELVEAYFNTNINDPAAVLELTQCIKDNCFVAEKNKYLQAITSLTPENIKKAKNYGNFSQNILTKNVGWIIMLIIMIIGMIIFGDDMPDSVYALAWIGIIIQIYIYYVKSVWNKITLDGKLIHPMLNGNTVIVTNTMTESSTITSSASHSESINSQEKATCKFCGSQLKVGAKFCTNCGKEQK